MSQPTTGRATDLTVEDLPPSGPLRRASGGRFMPEALVAALDELDRGLAGRRWPTRRSSAEFERILRDVRRHARACSTEADRLAARLRRRPGPAQARGPQPHRRPQDQQRARPGAAHQADGQDPGHRRDRRRPARRRHGHRRRALRPRLHRLHGRGRHRAPGAQRRPDAAARRRRSIPVELRQRARSRTPSTRRCATGSPTSTHTALPLRHRRPGRTRSPSMVRDFHRGHRRRGARPVPRADRRGCPTPSSPASAAAPTRSGIFHRLPRRRRASRLVRLRGRAATASRPAATRPRIHGRRRRACCTAPAPTCCRTTTARPIESHSISAGLDYPGVGPEHAYLRDSGRADVPPGHRRPRPWRRSRLLCRTEGIIPAHRVGARPRRRARQLGRGAGPRRTDPGQPRPVAATRTWARPSRGSVSASEAHASDDGRLGGRVGAAVAAAPRAARRWSATSRSGSRPSTGSIEAMRAMVDAGCDVDRGRRCPYSDPVMDGPIIQAAAQRRSTAGPAAATCCAAVEAVARRPGAAPVVMTYWNPVERVRRRAVRRRPRRRRGAGLITPDLTPDEARRVDRRRRRARPRQDLPGRAELAPTSGSR